MPGDAGLPEVIGVLDIGVAPRLPQGDESEDPFDRSEGEHPTDSVLLHFPPDDLPGGRRMPAWGATNFPAATPVTPPCYITITYCPSSLEGKPEWRNPGFQSPSCLLEWTPKALSPERYMELTMSAISVSDPAYAAYEDSHDFRFYFHINAAD